MLALSSLPERGVDLLTAQEVARRLAIGVRTLWRLVAQGKLPQPVRYSRKLVRWKVSDIDRYIQALSAQIR
ncbi:MAG TPA: AlpA family transcriptional regulator [Planctomycetales bacterium]|jgi:excisionase family DNA binding protein|nr:AlpA family transcriptional regulator [Planctomycetales bacterium]